MTSALGQRALLLLALFCSGAASLIFETIWVRILALGFGSTVLSMSLVTAAFFLGMGLGARLAASLIGRLRRPLLAYAVLELATGAYAVLSLPALSNLHAVYSITPPDLPVVVLAVLKASLAFVVMLLPSLAMGVTLPLMVVASKGLGRTGARTATLYGLNTAGAVFGTLLVGVVLLGAFGWPGTLLFGAALNVLAAALACYAHLRGWRRDVSPAEEQDAEASGRAAGAGGPLLLAGLGGFVGMTCEIGFARAFHVVLLGTVETAVAVLAAFLAGVALGSLGYRALFARRQIGLLGIGILLALSATSILLSAFLLEPLAYLGSVLAEQGGVEAAGLRFLCALGAMLLPAALSGALFPALVDWHGGAGGGRAVGRLLAANTVGSVAGSLTSGLLLLPLLGTSATLYLAVVILSVAALVCGFGARRRGLAVIVLGILLFASTLWGGVDIARLSHLRSVRVPGYAATRARLDAIQQHTSYAAEGAYGVVTLVESAPGSWVLNIDGLPQARSRRRPPRFPAESVLLGAIPAALAQGAERGLVIGMGRGITGEAMLAAGVAEVDVVELEPRVAEAVATIKDGRPTPTELPGLTLILGDGRDYLQRRYHQRSDLRYDVIASQPTHWWLAGVGSLATLEFYQLAYAALDHGGVYLQWMNSSRMTEEVLRGVVGAMRAVFDEILIFVADEPGLLYLAGVRGRLELDPGKVATRLQRPELSRMFVRAPAELSDIAVWTIGYAPQGVDVDAPSNRDQDALIETRLGRVAMSSVVNLADLSPPLLEQAWLPPSRLGFGDVQQRELVIEAAERRFNTPAGRPRQYRAAFDGAVPFGAADLSLARLAVRRAGAELDACWRSYLEARLALAQGRIAVAAKGLRADCPDQAAHPALARGALFSALIALDGGRCAEGLQALARAWSERPPHRYVRGLLRACLQQDPAEDFRAALSGWQEPGLPGQAMLWAVRAGEPVPAALLQRAQRAEPADIDALRALLITQRQGQTVDSVAEVAGRLARRAKERIAALQQRAQVLERDGEIDRAASALEELVRIAPRDPALTLSRIAFLRRHGRTQEAEEEARSFVDKAEDPATAARLLGLANGDDLSINSEGEAD